MGWGKPCLQQVTLPGSIIWALSPIFLLWPWYPLATLPTGYTEGQGGGCSLTASVRWDESVGPRRRLSPGLQPTGGAGQSRLGWSHTVAVAEAGTRIWEELVAFRASGKAGTLFLFCPRAFLASLESSFSTFFFLSLFLLGKS